MQEIYSGRVRLPPQFCEPVRNIHQEMSLQIISKQKTSLAVCTLWHRWKNKKLPWDKAVPSTQTGAGLQDSTKESSGDKARNCGCPMQRRTEVNCCIVRKWPTEDCSKSPGSLAEMFLLPVLWLRKINCHWSLLMGQFKV